MGKNLRGKELGRGLYQRKDGRYEAKAMIRGRKICLYGWNLKELKIRFEKEKENLENSFIAERKNIVLDDWFAEWFELYKRPYVKDTTASAIKRKYNHSFGYILGDRKIKDLINVDIQMAVNKLNKEGKAASTVKNVLGSLSQSMEVAKQNGLIDSNPCIGIKIEWKSQYMPMNAISMDMQIRFLMTAEGSWYKELIHSMFLTGLRMSEICGLQWKDIDWKKKCIHVQRTLMINYLDGTKVQEFGGMKTMNAKRCIPFMGDLEKILNEQKRKQERLKKELGKRYRAKDEFEDLVFITSMGSPINRYIVERRITDIRNEMNELELLIAKKESREAEILEKLTPHMIRHTFATRCFEKGMDIKVVQQLLGHAHFSTTMDIYTHVMDEKMREECGKFCRE